MTLCITIHKSQGEARVRDPHTGQLVATQHAQYSAALRPALNGYPYFWTPRKQSAPLVRKHVEALFGSLTWHGTPDIEGMYGMAEIK